MSIQTALMIKMKEAMKSKDTVALTALRALKSAFLLAKTADGGSENLSEEQELKIVQKQVKQRKDSATIYLKQKREDLANPELAEAKVLEQFLPKALSEEAVAEIIEKIITDIGATGMKDMGKVMGIASKQLVGQASGNVISTIVKAKLS